MTLTGENRNRWRKTCRSATLFSTNPAWTELGSNPGLRGERPATNSLSHGTANTISLSIYYECYKDAFPNAKKTQRLSYKTSRLLVCTKVMHIAVLSDLVWPWNSLANEYSSWNLKQQISRTWSRWKGQIEYLGQLIKEKRWGRITTCRFWLHNI